MKYKVISVLLYCLCSIANAQCYGTDSFKHCDDLNTGNSYDITRFGNITQVNGYNSRTGSTWNETATTYGNITDITGTDSNGNSWNENIIRNGNTTTYSGTDAQGNSFYKTCIVDALGNQNCF